jgi:cysteinyl-tRNA synthetase
LEAANTAYQKLLKQVEKIKLNSGNENINLENISENVKDYLEKFIKAMHDDLNTSIALATL